METFLFFKVSTFVFLRKILLIYKKVSELAYICKIANILVLHTFFFTILRAIIEPKKYFFLVFFTFLHTNNATQA